MGKRKSQLSAVLAAITSRNWSITEEQPIKSCENLLNDGQRKPMYSALLHEIFASLGAIAGNLSIFSLLYPNIWNLHNLLYHHTESYTNYLQLQEHKHEFPFLGHQLNNNH